MRRSIPAGTVLDQLPTPTKKSSTFLGWCYDEACTRYVDSKDRLLEDITLYAAYTDNQPMPETSMATYARASDVATDFSIPLTDTSGAMTQAQVQKAFTIKNVSDSSEVITLDVTEGENHTFVISNPNGWTPGSAYKLELKEKSLYFTGFDPTIRVYDFTVYREEIKNVELNKEIKYIHTKELSNLTVNGKQVDSVSIAVMTVGTDGGVTQEGSDTTGSFTYKKQALQVGDQIAVYSGDVIPTMDMSSSKGDDVSFFEITGADGDNYTYRGSNAEDILFMPDVLPLAMDRDQDGDPNNNSVTVSVSDLTFGNDAMSQALNLDSDTTVDEGDYLALYTGTEAENNQTVSVYGKITSVLLSGTNYIVAYAPVSEEEMRQTMDVYQKENVEGEELLEDTDVQALEEDIETQAVDSGFATEVAERVANAAMQTESFEELQESLSEDMNANIMIQSQGFGQLQRARAAGGSSSPRVELGKPTVKANLGTTLKHFDGDVSGLRLALQIGVPLTIHVNNSADIEILITATFEQEVRVAIDVDGSAVWKTWGFIPYIADYRVTASLELYEYTGIGLDVNFKTAEAGDKESKSKLLNGVNKITEELKSMMENGDDYIRDASDLVDGEQDEISVSKSLAERYSELLANESDWVEIYTRDLVNQHFRVILIIDIQVRLEFVVSANVNISIGMTYWYKNAKEYIFCIRIKDRTATNDTIDLVEEQYEFTAYAMGTLGIKAGVRLTISVGLLSTSLASVGVSADVGGYAQVWGYLYYELKYTASAGRSSRAMGAMYLEIGIYLEVKFKAQAFANAFTYNPTLYENEWPLYTVGVLENVLDFAYTQDSVDEINMKREIQRIRIPDEYFKMQYMDMKTGLDEGGKYYEKIYEDDTKHFNISMTNAAFSYDPATNIISVNPGNEPEQDGEMIITWKNQEGSFNTKPYARKIKLHWDRLRDGYYIAFQSNGGSFVDTIIGKYNSEIKKPADPARLGYTFAGWYADEDLTIPYTIPSNMPEQDSIVYAKWEAADVGYTVVEYKEADNGTYQAGTPVKMSGRTEEEVSPQPKEYAGYVTPPQLTETVKADGSTIINYYYAKDKYTQTFKSETENGETEVIAEGAYRYGTMMPTPAVYRPGYEFLGWEEETTGAEVPETVPAENRTYLAKWKALEGITYTVKYYVQNADNDGYTLSETQTLSGKMGDEVTAKASDLDTKVYHLKGELPKGTIKADGSLVLKVYYDLNEYKLTYDAKGGKLDTKEVTGRYGDKLNTPVPTRKGYAFDGWYTDEACENAFGGTMPAKDTTVYAKWERQKVNYTVRHLIETLPEVVKDDPAEGDGEEYPGGEKPAGTQFIVQEEEVFTAKPEDKVTPEVKTYEGFTSPEKQTVEVDGSGNTIVEYRYTRNTHTLKLVERGENEADAYSYEMLYGASIEDGGKAGYQFDGWYTDKDLKNKFEGTMPDKDLTLYAKETPVMSNYTVYHYTQGIPGKDDYSYILQETEELSALTESEVTPQPKTYEGFTSPQAKNGTVDGWGSPNIDYYYDRNSYNLTYVLNNGEANETATVYYEDDIAKTPKWSGYAFAGWYTDEACTNPLTETTMPAHDLTLYAKWEAGKKTYQVRHYQQSVTDEAQYDLVETETFTGTAGETVPLEVKAYEGFTSPEAVTATLEVSDEEEYFDYKYTRNQYQVTVNTNDGNDATTTAHAYKAIFAEKPWRAGYTFAGWYTDEGMTVAFDGVIPDHDITLYAKWEAQQVSYKVLHYLENANDDGKTLILQENLKAETDSKVTPEVKTYTGFTSPQNQEITVSGEGNTTVSYIYNRNVHTLTLKNYDGKKDETLEIKYEMSIPKATRGGYAFVGWYRDKDFKDKFEGTMPDEDLTLYAKWEANKVNYIVEHYLQNPEGDGYTLKETESKIAAVDSEVTPKVQKFTGFESPKEESAQISGEETTVVKYYYKRNVHTVTFKPEDGGKDVVITGRYGTKITAPTLSRTGYQFLGWDQEVESTIPADKDLTYTAQWKRVEYTLQFKAGEENDIAPIKGYYGDKVKAPADPKRTGYVFEGWYENGKKVENLPTTMPEGNHIYIASWTKETYQLTYDLNGGNMKSGEKNPETYEVDTIVFKLKNPVRAGYTFTGWSGTGIDGVEKNVSVTQNSTGDRSYKANWEENTYQIQFLLSGEGATGSMARKTVKYTEKVKLPKCEFTNKGHSFVRWYSVDSKKKKTYYSDMQEVTKLTGEKNGVVTLYPEWKANIYNVTFDYADGRAKTVKKVAYGTTYQFPTNVARYGWDFQGWRRDDTSTEFDKKKTESQLTDDRDLTLYATWVANSKYNYRPSNSGNTYRVTDKHEYTTFNFYVDGNQTSVKTTGDSGLKPARYHLNMNGISYNAVHQSYSKMTITISYKIKKVKDGYSDLRISYHTKSDNKEHTEWKKNTVDLKKKNGHTITCEYTLTTGSKIDVDRLTLEFDAHGKGPDQYDLSNLNVDIKFE